MNDNAYEQGIRREPKSGADYAVVFDQLHFFDGDCMPTRQENAESDSSIGVLSAVSAELAALPASRQLT